MDRDLQRSLTALAFLLGMFAVAMLFFGITHKGSQAGSPRPLSEQEHALVNRLDTVYGTTKEACQYQIDGDGVVTVTSGKCPVSDDKHSVFTEEDGCEYAITRHDKSLVKGSCRRHPSTIGDVTTDLINGEDGCDYALARDGEISKVPGSCPKPKAKGKPKKLSSFTSGFLLGSAR